MDNDTPNKYYSHSDSAKLNISDSEWKNILSPEVYEISRNKGTEAPFTGKYNKFDKKGTYYCKACGNPLFRSEAKFASSCGWPSFFEQINKESIVYQKDLSHGMIRTEILCGRCGGHLGHIFDDGPPPTGKRYCMNSIVMDFKEDETTNDINTTNTIDTIMLGGGCYWCIEAIFENLNGVTSVVSGFSGGSVVEPTYEKVCSGTTGHAEVVRLTYDKTVTNLEEILQVFFTVHDPTQLNRQGNDIGTQYRSAIFYTSNEQKEIAEKVIESLNKNQVYNKPIVTQVEKAKPFYKAESYHQNYYQNNKEQGYCRMVIQPKVEKFEKVFKDLLKNK